MALDFFAGCIGGASGVLVGYPFDTVKVRIQTQDVTKGKKYTGTFQCLSTIIKQEGAPALYRGMSSPLAGVTAINAIGFGVYGNVIRRLPEPESIKSITIAGVSAGLVQAFVCGPMELIKTQMQVRGEAGPLDTIKDIVNKGGIRALTRGMALTIVREVPGCGLYFGTFNLLVRGRENDTALVFAAGGIGGIVSWIFTYPQDVIKSRIQGDLLGKEAKYKGVMHCVRDSLSKEGPQFFVRGIGSTVVRAFPTNAATMGAATMIMRTFSEDKNISVYDTIARLQTTSLFQITLPKSVDTYFNPPRSYYNDPDIFNLATDGPSIIQISRSAIPISHQKLYVENCLVALPSKHYEKQIRNPKDPEVGTIRSNISLSTIYRLLERRIRARQEDRKFLKNSSNKAFADDQYLYGQNFVLDGSNFVVVHDPPAPRQENKSLNQSEDEIMEPSLLVRDRGHIERPEVITTSDFLIPSSLTQSSKSKIYGFYYLV